MGPPGENIKSKRKAHSPGTFQIINKSVKEYQATTDTSYTWGC